MSIQHRHRHIPSYPIPSNPIPRAPPLLPHPLLTFCPFFQHLPLHLPHRWLRRHPVLRLQDLDRGPVPAVQARRPPRQEEQEIRRLRHREPLLRRRPLRLRVHRHLHRRRRQELRRELDPRPPHQPPRRQARQVRQEEDRRVRLLRRRPAPLFFLFGRPQLLRCFAMLSRRNS